MQEAYVNELLKVAFSGYFSKMDGHLTNKQKASILSIGPQSAVPELIQLM
jgi:hypothetical protein